MKILVTGGTGFIGSHLVEKLSNHDIAVVSKHKTKKKKYYYTDITDKNKLNAVFSKEKPENVIHLAAQVNPRISMENPSNDIIVNVFGTLNILEMCKNHGIKKVIFASSAAVYGEPKYLPVDEGHKTLPLSIYGASKLTAEKYIEMYCDAYGIKYTILRYANVYGPRSRSVISIFIEYLMTGKKPSIFGDGSQTRDYIYVDDVVDATILSIEKADNLKLNIGTGNETSIRKIYSMVSSQLESTVKPVYKPEKKGEIKRIVLDISAAKKDLNWEPKIDVYSGIKKTISLR